MRIALISDIHANKIALEAVLDDIRSIGTDQIYCLGDVANLGLHPLETIHMIQELQCPCIMGNHDAFLIKPDLIHRYTQSPILLESLDWCRSRLTETEMSFIRGFMPSIQVLMDGNMSIALYHGSPRSHMEDILATTPPNKLDQMLDGRQADIFAGGHTHIQMIRQHRGRLIVNAGSVGSPFLEYVGGETPVLLGHAEYAIVESTDASLRIDLRRVALDNKMLWEDVRGSDHPFREWLLQQYA